MMSTETGTSDIRIVRAPQRTDDIGCVLRSAYSRPARLPDHWVRLLARLDRRLGQS
ncbi:hypothetical protein [Sphingomonas zeae]|jgi:hypothetical protein|uniref:Uncharacterized protein n=2 Tax=Sphingomonadaceae TaxID=41297 RepID=A0A7Y6B6X5_9SPHN|nr:hypothetical protein [Sphingomonas zeae]MBB4047376.1 hypothetical protein [Sphingomonas zeae]MDK8185264.1 hypothetical protein [Sphingomonas zeae]NUU48519.1 hypothetical protein [Sphingomonas zeae]